MLGSSPIITYRSTDTLDRAQSRARFSVSRGELYRNRHKLSYTTLEINFNGFVLSAVPPRPVSIQGSNEGRSLHVVLIDETELLSFTITA